MATTVTKKRNLKYLNSDFEGFKKSLIEHLRVYFPDSVQDFNESSSAMLLLEMMAFIGDNLSFYLDRRFEESFTETAREAKNLFRHAKQLGFKTFGKSPSFGTVDAFLKVPSTVLNGKTIPNMSYAGKILSSILKAKNGETFETVGEVDFSTVDINDNLQVVPQDLDSVTGAPLNFVLRKTGVDVKAGQTTTTTVTVTGYEAFRRITLPDEDVIEVVSVLDAEGNQWYEVEYLAQDTVFKSVANTGADATNVPYVLKLQAVPYRFTTEYDVETNKTSLVFGTGDASNLDGDLIPDLGDLALPIFGKSAFSGFSLDPQNFLKVRTLGLTPVDTTLTIKYRIGGGLTSNIGVQELDTVVDKTFEVADTTLNTATVTEVANSFEVLNINAIQGGKDQLSNEELRQLIAANFAAQNRVVTIADFVTRALSMPSKFGSVFRCNAKASNINRNAVDLFIVSRDAAGNVATAPGDLKTNLKNYLSQYRMITDAIEILDGEVVNIAVEFSILAKPGYNKAEVLASCLDALKDYFLVESWQLNQPVNKTDIIALLHSIAGVLSVIELNFSTRVGTVDGRAYSNTAYNIEQNTNNGIIYCDENKIFSVRYPNKDIFGTAK